MSFILDALRKSESERQQDARPSIARIPIAVPRHSLPTWAVATMAALGLGVVVLAGAWVKTVTESRPSSAAIATAGPGTELGRDGGPAAEPTDTYADRDAPRQEAAAYASEAAPGGSASDPSRRGGDYDRSRGSGYDQRRVEPLPLPPPRTAGNASPLAQVVQPPPLAMAARTQGSARDASGAAPRSTAAAGEPLPAVEGIPPPYHSVAASLDLPQLTLELLAFGDDPAQQFVFINGARYAAGDRLPDGARVIAINTRGAVLLVDGRQLQLEPR